MFTLKFKTHEKTFHTPVALKDCIDDPNHRYFLAAVNDRHHELSFKVDTDATITFLDVADEEAIFTYEASLMYLVAMALERLYPNAIFRFFFSVSKAVYIEFIEGAPILSIKAVLDDLNRMMAQLVEKDLPITRLTLSKAEAILKLDASRHADKIEAIHLRQQDDVHIYECDGYYNYMYSHMVPSTGYLKKYRFRAYSPGFLLEMPRAELNGEIPPFNDEPVFKEVLKDANRTALKHDALTVKSINTQSQNEPLKALIAATENDHRDGIAAIVEHLMSRPEIRVIAVTGPSSSGKTTFTSRLLSELNRKNLSAQMMSLDHYYQNRDAQPLYDGKPDLEHVEALDLALLQKDLQALIAGATIDLPHYDFTLGKRTHHVPLTLNPKEKILIEGIHALNPRVLSFLDSAQILKIFISPHLQLRLDHHNPFRLTSLRLLRRLVRDAATRGASVEDTLTMWPAVRKGEFKWIYPFLEDADIVFNSALHYEMGVLKYAIESLLTPIKRDNPHFITVNRLLKYLKHFTPIDPVHVPEDSILREFIGH